MLRRTVVPEGQAANLPSETTGELRLHLMREAEFQDRRALGFAHSFEVGSVRDIDLEALATRLGGRAHHGVFRSEIVQLCALRHTLAGFGDIGFG
jgi:hypothetical protein